MKAGWDSKAKQELARWRVKRARYPEGMPDLRDPQQKRHGALCEVKRDFARGWVSYNASQLGISYEQALHKTPVSALRPEEGRARGSRGDNFSDNSINSSAWDSIDESLFTLHRTFTRRY